MSIIPKIVGVIKRRFLINFRIDPEVLAQHLPEPFRPKTHSGYAIGGICLIRLENIRPKAIPIPFGISSENAAHRFAVEFPSDQDDISEGVFIPRRDTDSLLNHLVGGRVFPGVHHLAKFDVQVNNDQFQFSMESSDKEVMVNFSGRVGNTLPSSSCFSSLEEASSFFEQGSLGYSVTRTSGHYDGLILKTNDWKVEPFEVEHVQSSYFFDETIFPKGSIEFDHALFMKEIPHEWHSAKDICC